MKFYCRTHLGSNLKKQWVLQQKICSRKEALCHNQW